MDKALFLLFFVIVTFSCSKKTKNLNKNEISIIEQIIDDLVVNETNLKKSYLVNPYFNYFEFASYFKRIEEKDTDNLKIKDELLEKFKWNLDEYRSIQKQIDKKFLNKSYKELNDLSKTDSSRFVITFSGIQKNMIFIELINYCDSLSKQELMHRKNLSDLYVQDVYSMVAIISDSSLQEIIVLGGIHTEQCLLSSR